MRTVIVYESLFGNTHQVAEAIEEGIREADPAADVTCVRVGDAGDAHVEDADLLVLGGPTHVRGMSRGVTRRMGVKSEQAQQKAPEPDAVTPAGDATSRRHHLEPGAEGPGVREWLQGLPKAIGGKAAAFDTRGDSRMAGGAAHGIAKNLRHHGYQLVAEPEGFIIEDMEGPLRDGERERAKRWAAELVEARSRPS